MSDLTFSEITEITAALEMQFAQLRTDAKARYDLYTLRRQPEIPEDVAREGQVNILSSLPIHTAHTIRADLLSNPTEFTVIPLARESSGSIPQADQKRADNLEKALAVLWSRLNESRRVDREIIWHQLVSPFAVMILEAGDYDFPDQGNLSDSDYSDLIDKYETTRFIWRMITPDPMTCAFLEHNGKPTIFTRRYRMQVRDVVNTYSRKGEHSKDDLRLADGKWGWIPRSDDYDPSTFHMGAGEMLKEVEMIWLDDGKSIYHVALNAGGSKDGEMVWKGDNPFGRCSAFIVPGNLTPLRKPEDRYEPYLWSLMQNIEQINYVRTIRATASRNASGPDNYIPLDPEIIKIFEMNNKALPKAHRWKRNDTPYLLGQVLEKPAHVDPDLDRLELALNQDLQKLLPSPFVNVLDPAVVKSASATAILHAAEGAFRMYGPLMSIYDGQIKEVMGAIIYSLEHDYAEEDFYLHAEGGEMAHGKNLTPGARFGISKRALNFAYRISVRTRSMSQAQAQAQFESVLKQWILPDGSKGPASMEDLIDAANYTDKEAQKEKLAREKILDKIDPWIQEMALAAAIVKIEQRTGMKLPPPGLPPGGVGTQQPNPSGLPNSAQRMDAPNVVGPAGGTESTG